MGGMRESVVGRLLLVALVAAALWGAWNLTLRPYPSGSTCGTPVAVLTEPSVDIPRPISAKPSPPPGLDRDGNGRVTDLEREMASTPRVSVVVIRNGSQISEAKAAEAERVECRDALSEAGFWIRGTGPVVAMAGSVAMGMFVLTGHIRAPRTAEHDD